MNSYRIAAIGLFLYVVVGIVTFGHAAAHAQPAYDKIYADCAHTTSASSVCDLARDTPPPALSGIAAGLLWPFYWSWEAFSA
jgi:hypothetical protein